MSTAIVTKGKFRTKKVPKGFRRPVASAADGTKPEEKIHRLDASELGCEAW